MTKTLDRLLCVIAAAVLGGIAGILVWRVVGHDAAYLKKPALILGGLSLLCLIGAVTSGWFHRFIRACAILMINTVIVFGAAELICRAIKIDFNELLGARKNNEAFPIYFRLPTKQVGEVFFTREGPTEWSGKPLATLLKNHRSTDVAYTDEKELTVQYDKDGFRNPVDLTNWDIVIAGDSFTESGYLPPDQIFTGLVATKLGKRIKNLGVTDTGNFSHSFYLKTYGKAPSCKTAVLSFFEGNDLSDNVHEKAAQQTFQKTGERPSHDIPQESSLLKTLYHFARDLRQMTFRPRSYANASFKAKNGQEIPVSIADAPPSSIQMSLEEKQALDEALTTWVRTCKELGQEPCLLYLPCKRRVLDGHLSKAVDYPEPDWQPNDLPAYVQTQCQTHGIRFIDATPSLAQKSAEGILTYNTIYDTHLNTEGHQVVAKVLADALSQP